MTGRASEAPAARGRGQRGMTLIEVLVAVVIAALVVGAASAVLMTMWRTTGPTSDRLTSSASAFQTNARFVDDIRSATPIQPELAVRRGAQGCGGDGNSLLRVLVRTATGVEVRSYSEAAGGEELERRVCAGADLTAALAATPSVNRVTNDLAGSGAATVTCRANAGAAVAPATLAGDEECRIVTLDVETASGYEFRLEGRRDTIQSPVSPSTTTVKQCTLLSSGDTYVNDFWEVQYYGDKWHMSTFRRHGQGSGNGDIYSYLKVDLLGPCTGPGEPAFLPGGRRILSADLRLLLISIPPPDWGESNHTLRVVEEPWDEAMLTWENRVNRLDPASPVRPLPGVRPGGHAFDIGSRANARHSGDPYRTVDLPININVLDEVTRWYANAGWQNYGWRLDRGTENSGDQWGDDGFWWGTRESTDPDYWPRLTVTWE